MPRPGAEALSGPLRQMQEMARRIAKVSRDAKIKIEEDQYVETFKPFMMVSEMCSIFYAINDVCT